MVTTTTEITLSAGYRTAQRLVAHWLECVGGDARRSAFAARAALADLDAVDASRLGRWLAWLCASAHSRGNSSLPARIHRLDASLGTAVDRALRQLPYAEARPVAARLQRSA